MGISSYSPSNTVSHIKLSKTNISICFLLVIRRTDVKSGRERRHAVRPIPDHTPQCPIGVHGASADGRSPAAPKPRFSDPHPLEDGDARDAPGFGRSPRSWAARPLAPQVALPASGTPPERAGDVGLRRHPAGRPRAVVRFPRRIRRGTHRPCGAAGRRRRDLGGPKCRRSPQSLGRPAEGESGSEGPPGTVAPPTGRAGAAAEGNRRSGDPVPSEAERPGSLPAFRSSASVRWAQRKPLRDHQPDLRG